MGNFPRLCMGYFPRLCMGIAVLCRFAWPAQGIVHRVNSEQNVKVLEQIQLQPPVNYTTLVHRVNCEQNVKGV